MTYPIIREYFRVITEANQLRGFRWTLLSILSGSVLREAKQRVEASNLISLD